jgi:hypothetical protein
MGVQVHIYFVLITVYNHNMCPSEALLSKFNVHSSKCLHVHTFRCSEHINAIVQFLPYPLQHFRCGGLHRTFDSVVEILERLGPLGHINRVVHVPHKINHMELCPGTKVATGEGGIFTCRASYI